MSFRTIFARGSLVAATLAATLPPPAHALVVPSKIGVFIRSWGDYFEVCGKGEADPSLHFAGEWEFAIAGVRSTGTPVQVVVRRLGRTFDNCLNTYKVFKNAPYGHFTVSLTFMGSGADIVGQMYGQATWSPFVPDIVVALSTGY